MRSSPDVDSGANQGHFSDPQFLVLASLAAGPKHGHAMLQDVEAMSGTRLGPGTLYGAIARLEEQGWIERLPSEERRKPYRLTKGGQQAFTAKAKTLQRIASVTAARLASA